MILCEKYVKIKAKVTIKLKIMEFDEGKLKFVPEKEKRKFLLKDEYNGEDNRRMNIDEFLERREKETPEETEKYEKEAERIMSMEGMCKKGKRMISINSVELNKIRKEDPYAAWRIFDIVLKKKQK